MSWSVNLIGAADKIVDALTAHGEQMTDPTSKAEYSDALPHLIGAVKQNFEQNYTPTVKVIASGTGYMVKGEAQSRTFAMTVERFYGTTV
jgi:ABC-type tungstate transport system permease subunit